MNKRLLIEIDTSDLNQILDGLRCREESWRNTAIYLHDDYFPDDDFICEECNNMKEAEAIANHYRDIIKSLENQHSVQQNALSTNEQRNIYLQGKADGQDNLIVRVQAQWVRLHQLPVGAIVDELRRLTDEICDD